MSRPPGSLHSPEPPWAIESIATTRSSGIVKFALIFISAFASLQSVRLLVEILIVAGLIYLGWEQPLKARLEQLEAGARAATASMGSKFKPATHHEQATAPAATATPTRTP